MNGINSQMAARVWERVHAAPQEEPNPGHALPMLIATEWVAAATYLHLSRRFQGKESRMLRQMFQEEQSHAACLRGIYTLITGQHASVKAPPVPQDNTQAILRRCYGEEMRSLAEYEQWSAHREYGPVFARLAQQERDHCRILLEILGSLK